MQEQAQQKYLLIGILLHTQLDIHSMVEQQLTQQAIQLKQQPSHLLTQLRQVTPSLVGQVQMEAQHKQL